MVRFGDFGKLVSSLSRAQQVNSSEVSFVQLTTRLTTTYRLRRGSSRSPFLLTRNRNLVGAPKVQDDPDPNKVGPERYKMACQRHCVR